MIYTSKASAEQAARELNAELGHPPAWVTPEGNAWTVIRSWLKPRPSAYIVAGELNTAGLTIE